MIDEAVLDYEVEIAFLIQQANEGKISKADFRRRLAALVGSTLMLMFLLAGGNRVDKAAMAEVARLTKIHDKSISTLTRDVYGGKYRPSAAVNEASALAKVKGKVTLWGTTAVGVYNLGRAFHRDPERRFTWLWGDTIAHCSHCAAQNGKTRTASEWRKLRAQGIYPQSPSLQCKGWRCRCQLVEADPQVDDLRDVLQALTEV